MADYRTQIHAALDRLRNAESRTDAQAARNDAKTAGLRAMRAIKDKEQQKQFAESLDADIAKAWRESPGT